MKARHLPVAILITLLTVSTVSADFDLAADAYKRKDYPTALATFTDLAEAGDARAQTVLALMHKYGEGTPVDLSTALAWYLQAAQQGYAPAQFHAGVMLAEGIGTTPDQESAVEWLRKAAKSGFSRANDKLADLAVNRVVEVTTVDEYTPWSRNWDLRLPSSIRSAPPAQPASVLDPYFRVQLGAMSSKNGAERLWRNLSAANPQLFSGYTLLVKESQAEGKTLYRVQTGPFDTHGSARRFCNTLTASLDTGCLPILTKP